MAEKINCKEHFNPREFDLTIEKIAKIRKTKNCKYNINYHYTWIPKTRAKILVEPFRSEVKKFLLETCQEKEWDPLALQIMPDHIHFFMSAPPKWAPSRIIQELKADSSRKLRKRLPRKQERQAQRRQPARQPKRRARKPLQRRKTGRKAGAASLDALDEFRGLLQAFLEELLHIGLEPRSRLLLQRRVPVPAHESRLPVLRESAEAAGALMVDPH